MDNEFYNLGRRNQETEVRIWYLKENIQAREEGAENFLPQRHLINLFHRNHFAKNGDIFIESTSQSDSQIKEDYFADKSYLLNSSQARKDKIQLGYQWKGGKISAQAERDFDFIDPNSRLNTDFIENNLLTAKFQQSYFFAPYFKIDFKSQWDSFDFEQEENWEGARLTTSLKNQLFLGNSYFFFYPSLQFMQKNYQSNYSTTDTQFSRNFTIEPYPSFALDTGLNFEKFTKSGRWNFQPKVLYEKIMQQNSKKALQNQPPDNNYEVTLDPLFDSQDTILAKNIARFSLLWDFQKYQKKEKQFFLELSVVYDLDPIHSSEDIEQREGSYIALENRENALSLEEAIMPVHLSTKWLVTKNLQFSYFTRYDSFAHKDLEHLFQVNYKKNRNSFAATFHKNIRNYTNFNNENFYKKTESTISIKKSLSKYWSSSLLLERNHLIDQELYPFESQVIGKGIDEVTLGFIYKDCCTIAKISLYEKIILATQTQNSTLDRGISLDFQLQNQF